MVLVSSRAEYSGSMAGSSRPEPSPEVPRMIPLTVGRVFNLWTSETIWEGGADRGRDAKA